MFALHALPPLARLINSMLSCLWLATHSRQTHSITEWHPGISQPLLLIISTGNYYSWSVCNNYDSSTIRYVHSRMEQNEHVHSLSDARIERESISSNRIWQTRFIFHVHSQASQENADWEFNFIIHTAVIVHIFCNLRSLNFRLTSGKSRLRSVSKCTWWFLRNSWRASRICSMTLVLCTRHTLKMSRSKWTKNRWMFTAET